MRAVNTALCQQYNTQLQFGSFIHVAVTYKTDLLSYKHLYILKTNLMMTDLDTWSISR